MSADNKRNVQFFEAPSMRELYDCISTWQVSNRTRFLAISIQQDGCKFCCIALTNPSEIIIVDGERAGGAQVIGKALRVWDEGDY